MYIRKKKEKKIEKHLENTIRDEVFRNAKQLVVPKNGKLRVEIKNVVQQVIEVHVSLSSCRLKIEKCDGVESFHFLKTIQPDHSIVFSIKDRGKIFRDDCQKSIPSFEGLLRIRSTYKNDSTRYEDSLLLVSIFPQTKDYEKFQKSRDGSAETYVDDEMIYQEDDAAKLKKRRSEEESEKGSREGKESSPNKSRWITVKSWSGMQEKTVPETVEMLGESETQVVKPKEEITENDGEWTENESEASIKSTKEKNDGGNNSKNISVKGKKNAENVEKSMDSNIRRVLFRNAKQLLVPKNGRRSFEIKNRIDQDLVVQVNLSSCRLKIHGCTGVEQFQFTKTIQPDHSVVFSIRDRGKIFKEKGSETSISFEGLLRIQTTSNVDSVLSDDLLLLVSISPETSSYREFRKSRDEKAENYVVDNEMIYQEDDLAELKKRKEENGEAENAKEKETIRNTLRCVTVRPWNGKKGEKVEMLGQLECEKKTRSTKKKRRKKKKQVIKSNSESCETDFNSNGKEEGASKTSARQEGSCERSCKKAEKVKKPASHMDRVKTMSKQSASSPNERLSKEGRNESIKIIKVQQKAASAESTIQKNRKKKVKCVVM